MSKVVIDAAKTPFSLNIKELYSYRDLFLLLAYRDLRVRYAQTFLGLLWAFLQPLATLLIFVLIFGRGLKVDTGGLPYPIFALAGMAPWSYFSYVLQQSGISIIGAQEMVKKVYFPRLLIPLSKSMTGFVDMMVTIIILMVLLVWYQLGISSQIIMVPAFLALAVLAALGVGIWISALTIRYRDFQHVVPFMAQLGLYATPIAYPSSLIPDKYQWVYHLNPMAGIVEGFRWCFLLGSPLTQYIYLSTAITVLLFFSGLYYFKKVERVMADLV